MKKSNAADKPYYDEYVTEYVVRTERKDKQTEADREATRQEVLNTYLTAKKHKNNGKS